MKAATVLKMSPLLCILTSIQGGFELCLFTSGSLFRDPFEGVLQYPLIQAQNTTSWVTYIIWELNDGRSTETANRLSRPPPSLHPASFQPLPIRHGQVLVSRCFLQKEFFLHDGLTTVKFFCHLLDL